MAKVIAAINMTLDDVCDHTISIADPDLHAHYAHLLDDADTILYGRITYQLMQYWKPFLNNPSEDAAMNQFATSIDRIKKIVFSNTLKDAGWKSAIITNNTLTDEVSILNINLKIIFS